MSGFTLTETLVVMAVVIVLTVLSLGGINLARQYSKQAKSITNLRNLGLGCMTYANEHNGFFPANTVGRDGPIASSLGNSLHEGAPPRKMLSRESFSIGRGTHDYVSTADFFYSPFAERIGRLREPGTFFRDTERGLWLIGYFFIYQTRESPIVPGLSNEHVTDSPRTPLFFDMISTAEVEEFSSRRFTCVRADGSVHSIARSEMPASWAARIKKMAGVR